MPKFNLKKSIENTSEKTLSEKASILENKKDFDFRQIPFEQIKPNEKNFYSLVNIEELAKSIKEFGLLHNITVLEVATEGIKYFKIISGERRYRAIEHLRSVGEDIQFIPCKVVKGITEIEEELMLLKGNSDTRELTQEEKRKQVEKLTELYNQRVNITGEKANKKEIKETIANDIGISSKQVERYNVINENLIPQLQEYFDKDKINFKEAIEFARLDEQMQLAILDLLQQKDKISVKEIEIIKFENKRLEADNKAKEMALQEKESELLKKQDLIFELEAEKQDLEEEKERLSIEQETIEDEKKDLETKIREELAVMTEEELNKHKESLEEAEKKIKLLGLKEKELTEKLQKTEEELEGKVKELEEHEEEEADKETPDPIITKEALEKAVAQEKFKELKKTTISNIISLGELVKKTNCVSSIEIEEALKEMEKAIQAYKKKTS